MEYEIGFVPEKVKGVVEPGVDGPHGVYVCLDLFLVARAMLGRGRANSGRDLDVELSRERVEAPPWSGPFGGEVGHESVEVSVVDEDVSAARG